MILSEINFFIKCARELKPIHEDALPPRKKQLETFLKTWLWYNSSSKNIFWTGKTSEAGIINRVKEHQYSNLSSVRYIMDNEIMNENFFDLSNQEQFKRVFKFMQWNYTSSAENISLKQFQDANVFYGVEINGDPEIAYQMAEINLFEENETANILPRLNSFLEYNGDTVGYIFEIDLTNRRLTNFMTYLTDASNRFGIELFVIQFSKKGCIYRLINNQNNFTDLYRLTMYSLWKCFRNTNEIDEFLNTYNYAIVENGPYRIINNFTYPTRAFPIETAHQNYGEIYLDTYNDIPYKFNLISKILDFFDATCVVYDYNLDIVDL